MKKLILLICFVVIYSCSSIRVATDYKTNFDFKNIKTYAFSKSGIDKAELNDIDKKRILKAIDVELYNKGLRKSSIEPDIIVNFYNKTNKKIDYYPTNNYYGYGVGFGGMGHYSSSWYLNSFSYNEGVLFIDFIDFKNNELIWQGIGKGYLNSDNISKKNEIIKSMVSKILLQFPPAD